MPTATYVPLANITLGSSASIVTFTSISQSYRDLVLQVNGSILSGTATMLVELNGDGSTFTNWITATADGSQVLSQAADWVNLYTTYGHVNMSTTQSLVTINAMDYSATDKHKTFLVRSSSASNSISALVGKRASNAAITSIRLFLNTNNFAAGSTFALYGIAG